LSPFPPSARPQDAALGLDLASGNTVVTEQPASTLAAFLNRTFGLNLANQAEACGWLAGGGWPRLESWLAVHRNDRPRRAVTPPQSAD
jgi:hypothetical protein